MDNLNSALNSILGKPVFGKTDRAVEYNRFLYRFLTCKNRVYVTQLDTKMYNLIRTDIIKVRKNYYFF